MMAAGVYILNSQAPTLPSCVQVCQIRLSTERLELRELDIPPEKIEAFIEHIRAQYASGWSGGHEYFLREKLNLQNPTLTHAVRLWVCVDFSGLLRSHGAASSSIAANAASRFFARGASASSSAQPPVKTPEPGG